jgi:hypothetical protein
MTKSEDQSAMLSEVKQFSRVSRDFKEISTVRAERVLKKPDTATCLKVSLIPARQLSSSGANR